MLTHFPNKAGTMRRTTFLRLWLVVLAVGVCSSKSHPSVRTPGNSGPPKDVPLATSTSRRLQELAGMVVNSLIAMVTPAISGKLSYVVQEYYDDYNVEWAQQENLVSVKRVGSSLARELTNETKVCDGSDLEVEVGYAINAAQGLGSMTVETIRFLPDTQKINLVSRGVRIGAAWSGQWMVNVWIPQLITDTTTIFNTSCNGMAIEVGLAINGTTTFNDVEATAIVTVTGDTERIIFFPTTSQLSTGHVDNFTYSYEEMDITNIFGDTPPDDLTFDANALVNSLFTSDEGKKELHEYFQQLYVKALQEEIDWILPRDLIGDGFDGEP
jgi:hypothetical protein